MGSGFSEADALRAIERTLVGLVCARPDSRVESPRASDSIAWTSYQRGLREPALVAELFIPRDRRSEGRAWFESYSAMLDASVVASQEGGPYRCPCCRRLTLEERGGFDICPVCFWEDDGQDDRDADIVRGGPNGGLSLTEARENYLRVGASHVLHDPRWTAAPTGQRLHSSLAGRALVSRSGSGCEPADADPCLGRLRN